MNDVVVSFASDAQRSAEDASYLCAGDDATLEGRKRPVDKLGCKGDHCLTCSVSLYKKRVFPCAMSFDRYTGNLKFGPGKFCQPECSLGFLEETRASAQALSFTKWMFMELYGFPNSRVHSCLPRWSLKHYGGPLDISNNEEHRQIFRRDVGDKVDNVRNFDSISGIPYAMVLEVKMARDEAERTPDEALALSGRTAGLQRPKTRDRRHVARCEATGEQPYILNKFAEMLARQADIPKAEGAAEAEEDNDNAATGNADDGAEEEGRDHKGGMSAAPEKKRTKVAGDQRRASKASSRARPRRRKK